MRVSSQGCHCPCSQKILKLYVPKLVNIVSIVTEMLLIFLNTDVELSCTHSEMGRSTSKTDSTIVCMALLHCSFFPRS